MIIRYFSRFLYPVLILLLFSVHVTAWDEVGHKLTAYIAWQQMKPETREKAFNLLIKAPENSDLSVPYDSYNSRSEAVKKLELFMYASVWPDVLKDAKYPVRNKTYNQYNWHFSDIFWKQVNGEAVVLKDFQGDGGFAIPKLYDFEKTLRASTTPDSEKSIALAWFLHVGGDIHNPLHNASRVTDTEPKGDQGGNLVTLREGNKTGVSRINLHGYWDQIIGDYSPRKNDQCDTNYLAPIARKIMKKYPLPRLRKRLRLHDYKEWNIESFRLLPELVYTPEIVRNELPSKKYRKRTFKTAEEQIALAGYRLGETLNQIFAE